MKKLCLLIALLSLSYTQMMGQDNNERIPDYRKLHYLSEEEMHMPVLSGVNFLETPPPVGPVRMVAEFEPMQAVLIRYPLGIPYTLIAEMSQDIEVITRVTSESLANEALQVYQNNNVNTANCSFLITPYNGSDTYWTRDYGPWFVFDGNNQPGICDFPYNRPRPGDDEVPVAVAELLGISLYGMNMQHTGGNMMVDGLGMGASTDLVYEENTNLTHAQIQQKAEAYLGLSQYDITADPLDDYIKHIDCWGKYLAPDKILIGQVPPSDYRYGDYEAIANYFANENCSYGYPYRVYRVFTPGTPPNTPYTNSLILNNKVFVPITGSQYDNQALAVYEDAMPGYEIIGINYNGWYNTDALHCRAIGIADIGMLFIDHRPYQNTIAWSDSTAIDARIVAYAGEGLYQDSLLLHYRINNGAYQQRQLMHVSGENYETYILNYAEGDTIYYYLTGIDSTDRHALHPFMGAADPHMFVVGTQAQNGLEVTPDTLYYIDNLENSFKIINHSNDAAVIESMTTDPMHAWLPNPPEFPYTLPAGDSLEVLVVLNIPVQYIEYEKYMIHDSVEIQTNMGAFVVHLEINSSLIEDIKPIEPIRQLAVYPNPVTDEMVFMIQSAEGGKLNITLFNINGKQVKTPVEAAVTKGANEIRLNCEDDLGLGLAPGLYMYRISTPGQVITGRIVKL